MSTQQPKNSANFKLDRLGALSDGVIAIAITILVLGIQVPSPHKVPESKLTDYLYNSIDPMIGFVVSFVLIGTYWLEQFMIFHFLTHTTRMFIALNGVFLLCLSFLPFPTGLQAAYRNDELAMAFYGFANMLCSLSLLWIWLYASKNRQLIQPKIPQETVNRMTKRLLVPPVFSLIAIGCSFISISLSRLVFLAIPIYHFSYYVADPGVHPVSETESSV
ncbi:TMEM175 family protein [Thalassoglobus sp. JC818]|uniref:TMEM175 family protein n=1 Tax=Thalassoglobus sp. JC818 TaxID=3232136 RepID=UPI003459482F